FETPIETTLTSLVARTRDKAKMNYMRSVPTSTGVPALSHFSGATVKGSNARPLSSHYVFGCALRYVLHKRVTFSRYSTSSRLTWKCLAICSEVWPSNKNLLKAEKGTRAEAPVA